MAFLEEQLKKVQLKHAQHEFPKKQSNAFETICSGDEDYDKLLSETSFEQYYSLIEPFSFKSSMFELDEAECLALVAQHQQFKQFRAQENTALGQFELWKMVGQQDKTLAALCQKIDTCISKCDTPGAVFVRLSLMSPKDAVTNRPDFAHRVLQSLQLVREKEKQFQHKYGDALGSFQTEDNRRIYAVYLASISGLKLSRGEDAVQLFIESKRALQNFETALQHFKEHKPYSINVIVRDWCDFDVSMEFRAFVYKGKLTGITQYNPYVYFPFVKHEKSKLEKLMVDFLNQHIIGKSNSLTSFVVDIILAPVNNSDSWIPDFCEKNVPPEQLFTVKIVELNPLAEFAGACMFEWHKPQDKDILLGKSPFEFRIVEEANKFVLKILEEQWKMFVYPEKLLEKK